MVRFYSPKESRSRDEQSIRKSEKRFNLTRTVRPCRIFSVANFINENKFLNTSLDNSIYIENQHDYVSRNEFNQKIEKLQKEFIREFDNLQIKFNDSVNKSKMNNLSKGFLAINQPVRKCSYPNCDGLGNIDQRKKKHYTENSCPLANNFEEHMIID